MRPNILDSANYHHSIVEDNQALYCNFSVNKLYVTNHWKMGEFVDNDSRHGPILAELRKRICFSDPSEQIILGEVDLAAEFQVSRTPIRQVLQRLAYEKLVVIRSGVGTMSPALSNDDRESHFLIFNGLVRIACELEEGPVSTADITAINGVHAFIDAREKFDIEDAFYICATFLSVLSSRVNDSVLSDALGASYWRAMRWISSSLLDIESDRRATFIGLFTQLKEECAANQPKLLEIVSKFQLNPPK